MRLKLEFILILLSFITFTPLSADTEQDNLPPSSETQGKVIVRTFIDYSTNIDKFDNSGFNITRAFLGYNYTFSKTLQSQIIVDGASGLDDKKSFDPYLRNAFISWQDKGFTVSGGLIGSLQFKLQEKIWNHRYILRSYQDLNKVGASTDLGLTSEYMFNDIISADISLLNGEGYKKIEKNNSNLYGLGVTATPLQNLYLRVYGDIYTESKDAREALPADVANVCFNNQYNLALFAGYTTKSISTGIEYNRTFNKGFVYQKNSSGYSIYSSVFFSKKLSAFARFDWQRSTDPLTYAQKSWNLQDGEILLLGLEFKASKQLKISPNIRNLKYDGRKSEQYLFFNVEFNL